MKKIASASLATLAALVIAGTAYSAWTTMHGRTVNMTGLGGAAGARGARLPRELPDATATLLHRAGLTPPNMAAAGCTLEQVNAIIDLMSVRALVPGFIEDLEVATAALNERLNQHLRPFAAQDENTPPRDTATVAERQQAVDALLDEAFTFATTGLANSSQQTLLASIRENSRWSAIPAPYLVVNRTPPEQLRLRQALTATAQAARDGRIQPGAAQAIIEHANEDALVTAARTASETNLEAITDLWQRRVEDR